MIMATTATMAFFLYFQSSLSLLFILFFSSLSSITLVKSDSTASTSSRTTTYIVHMNSHHKPSTYATHSEWYTAHLHSLSIDTNTILYAYESVFAGFAVSLSPSQADSLRLSSTVLSVYPDVLYKLHTTRTPAFMGLGLDSTVPAPPDQASTNVIVGVIDTGITPESPSFSDSGMPNIPQKWRGQCETGANFAPSSCNRKLIGARSFYKGYEEGTGEKVDQPTPRDDNGHGTHTASTVAGSRVPNATLLGYATGTARGMAPGARIAAYKV